MAISGKREQGKRKLHELLLELGEVSIQQIQERLDLKSRKSAYNYIEFLKEAGFELDSRTVGKESRYFIKDRESEIVKYEILDRRVLQIFTIVRAIQKNPMCAKDLFAYFGLGNYEKDYNENIHGGKLNVKTANGLKKILKVLITNGIIVEDSNGMFYHTGKLIPPMLKLNEDEFYDLKDTLENIVPGHPYYNQLHSIYEKQNIICGDITTGTDDAYIVQGKNYINFQEIDKAIEKFVKANYVTKLIDCTIRDKNGNLSKRIIAVGLLMYSADKDRLYIFGKSYGRDGKLRNMSPIDCENIVKIDLTDLPNTIFENREYMNSYYDMFSVSNEKAEPIEIEFINIYNNLSKLEQLCKQRPKAKLVVKGDIIRYTDIASGMGDLANFLRSYGKYFKVIRPETLRRNILRGAKQNLQRYEDLKNGKLL